MSMPTLQKSFYWIGFVLFFVAAFMALGAVCGAILYGVWAMFDVPAETTTFAFIAHGAANGAKLFGVWAGGLGMIVAVIKHRHRFSLRTWLRARQSR
jgi:hypothetical protein